MYGFYRVAAVVPPVRVADVAANVGVIADYFAQAAAAGAAIVLFPELSLTAYTCADLFHQQRLLDAAVAGLGELAANSRGCPALLVVGAPLLHAQRLYNCAVAIQDGRVLGVVPKTHLPTYREYYEKRWFRSGRDVRGETLLLAGDPVPFGIDLLFDAGEALIGVELCEDAWAVVPPSSRQALAGANILLNLSASNDLVAKAEYRRALLANQSARCVAAYAYAGAGVHESTTDMVFGGHALIFENGRVLAENERFARDGQILTADVDCQKLRLERNSETVYKDEPIPACRRVPLDLRGVEGDLCRPLERHPFVPGDLAQRGARCREIFNIQAAGLARRLEHLGGSRPVIGISGGLDSTLALLVVRHAMDLLERPAGDILAVSMPGFGTSDRTRRNAKTLIEAVGAEGREIDIAAACRQHFTDIGHDGKTHDTTYENVQARERTQILMDLANQVGGIVVGTGDLSEIALGWSTYNGDHMSMYAVNCSVPKTLIKFLLAWAAEQQPPAVRRVLDDVLDTPISPELLPVDAAGDISQRTEDVIGPYELHDFFLYHTVKYGAPPEKVRYLAGIAFGDDYSAAEIGRWHAVFVKRFWAMQFKRSCIPDGPKVGTISLSPRADWRMPSDASAAAWED